MKYYRRTMRSRLSLLLAALMLTTATASACRAGGGNTTDATEAYSTTDVTDVTDMTDATDILETSEPEETELDESSSTEPEVTELDESSSTEPEETTTEPEVTELDESSSTEPEETTPEPEVTTTEPEVTTTEPEVTTPEPEETTTEPEVTTPEPEVTELDESSSTEPEETTTEPEETELDESSSTEPEVTTTEPEETELDESSSTEPEVTTTEPEVTTTEPEVTTPEPEVTTTEPEVTTTEPEVTTTEPEVTTTEPEVTTTEPEVTTTEPDVTTTEPEVTTPEPEDIPTEPTVLEWQLGVPTSTVKHVSFDEINPVLNGNVGLSIKDNEPYVIRADRADSLRLHGWVCFSVVTPYAYGYILDGGAPVVSDSFTVAPEQAVIDAAVGSFAAVAVTRFGIIVPMTVGRHTVQAVVREADGTLVVIAAFDITVTESVDGDDPIPDGSVTITHGGGTATVTDGAGLTYTATGYRSASADAFVINQNFTVQFGGTAAANAAFNRFSVAYTSTQPLKVVMTYVEDGITKTDSFFLEAGEHTFSCVTKSYLAGEKGSRIVSMAFSSCNGADASFLLRGLATYDYPVYGSAAGDTYYISGSAYRLGIRLSWGGGINYLYDQRAASVIPGVENLINQADTGRLVQQSYYGAREGNGYVAGTYNGSPWTYNPVQGGDVYQNHSRIIDIVVSENAVYVKSQPQDWSLNNRLTPSYMENTYTLYDDRVQVDNRFVDFSGMTHPYSHQELPAFYTLSCFDRFNWYDGSQGWTGGAISHRDNLGFWGDAAYYEDCKFPVKQSNTETWCAWTSSAKNYGIGLYVPGVDLFLAGRFGYDGSTSALAGSTNYVAPLVMKKLVSYKPIEYSYLITTGSVEQIRATFARYQNFASNSSLHVDYQSMRVEDGASSAGTPIAVDLANPANAGAVTAGNNVTVSQSASPAAVELRVLGDDPGVFLHLPAMGTIPTSGYKTLVIEYMIPTDNARASYQCDVFVCAGGVNLPDPNCRVRANLVKNGQFCRLEIDLSQYGFWVGNLNALRFDFFDVAAAGDRIYLRSVTLQ